jgi:sulfur carrier protein
MGDGAPAKGERTVLVNGEPRALPDEATLASLLASLRLSPEWVLVERNGEPVERARYATLRLAPGDRIELATPMAGG